MAWTVLLLLIALVAAYEGDDEGMEGTSKTKKIHPKLNKCYKKCVRHCQSNWRHKLPRVWS